MLTKDERREVRIWIHDHVGQIRKKVEWAKATLTPSTLHKSESDLVTRTVYLVCQHFEITDADEKKEVESIAVKAVTDKIVPVAMFATPMIRLSREDLLDIAFFANREDSRTATMFQVEEFIRTVVRENLKALREQRVPPKKFVIKRAKS